MEPRRRDRVQLAAEEVIRAWDLGRWEDWHRTPKGSTNTSYFVTTDRGRFVVRISNNRKTDEGARREVALVDHLRRRGYPAPRVVPSRAGAGFERIRGRVCLVTERLPGAFPDLGDPHHLAESARALARFHQEGRSLPEPTQPIPGSEIGLLEEGPGLLSRAGSVVRDLADAEHAGRFERLRSVFEPAFGRVGRAVSGSNGALPVMVTHGSLGVSAVLFEGTRLTAVLDYERAAREVRALDLAYTLRALTRRPKEEPGAFDLPRVRAFMAAYRDVEELAPGEAERLPDVMAAQRLLKVAGKSSNFLAKHVSSPQEPKDALKLTDTLEEEIPRLRWLEEHRSELFGALQAR